MNEIKATLDDVDILCGYLHDAHFTPSGIAMDAVSKRFTLDFGRICYEMAEKGKILFFIPVVRYPRIESRFTVTNVLGFKQEWFDDAFDGPNDKHTLMDVVKTGDNILEVTSEFVSLKMTVCPSTQLIIEDISEPSVKQGVTDFSRSVFGGMDKIEEIRRRPTTRGRLSLEARSAPPTTMGS